MITKPFAIKFGWRTGGVFEMMPYTFFFSLSSSKMTSNITFTFARAYVDVCKNRIYEKLEEFLLLIRHMCVLVYDTTTDR